MYWYPATVYCNERHVWRFDCCKKASDYKWWPEIDALLYTIRKACRTRTVDTDKNRRVATNITMIGASLIASTFLVYCIHVLYIYKLEELVDQSDHCRRVLNRIEHSLKRTFKYALSSKCTYTFLNPSDYSTAWAMHAIGSKRLLFICRTCMVGASEPSWAVIL